MEKIVNMFNGLIDFFVHPKLKNSIVKHERARATVGLMLFMCLFLVMFTVYFVLTDSFFSEISISNFFGILLFVVYFLLIKYTGRIRQITSYLLFVGFLMFVNTITGTGGISSQQTLWLGVVIMMAYIVTGAREGLFFSFASIIVLTLLYVNEAFLGHVFRVEEVVKTVDYKFFNSLIIIIIISIIVHVLVSWNKRLLNVLRTEKENTIREEIARDFHDQIGNKLASISQLSALLKDRNTGRDLDILERLENNANQVYSNFKDFIWYQSPTSNDVLHLFMYLKDFGEDFLKYSKIDFYAELDQNIDEGIELKEFCSREIVAICKEVITNASKHANCKSIGLKFSLSKYGLLIIITDDGVGFDIEHVKSGNGLRNIKKRALRMDAQITIFSEIDNGVTVELNCRI